MKRLFHIAFAISILTTSSGHAEEALGFVPVPSFKPPAPFAAQPPADNSTVPVASDLKSGLDALSDNDGVLALSIRNRMPQSLDRHMLTWSIAMSGVADIPSHEIAAAQKELKGWPGLEAFRANSERALYRENPPAPQVLAAFGNTDAETPEGTIVLARARLAEGDKAGAARLIVGLWRHKALDTDLEDKILDEFSGLLTTADHKARMDYLLYRSRVTQAKRFAKLGEANSLFNAWSAVINRSSKADDLIKSVDSSWAKDPAFLFMRIENLRHQDKYEEASNLLARMPRDPRLLINTTEWWNEERIVARGLADAGNYRSAYRIVANHIATSPTDIVDAEFHAGWFALRGLKDTKAATRHFSKILAASSGPISGSRAWYWLGRTAEQAGDTAKADENFAKAATYPGTFYGQLAAARLKQPILKIRYPHPSAADRINFYKREAVRAITRYEDVGHGWRANSLYRALAEQIDSPGELALLAAQAEKAGNHQMSLQIGKIAYGRGIDVPALAYPIGVIPQSANIAGSGTALAYAVARQESAFNPGAVSPANARGLLQLLPGTAKGVARRHNIAYSAGKLVSDAGYNATLGAHYLGEQIDSFDGSYILTFIAYNAGPARVPEWIARYGDPRGLPIDDVVDWIERIPFPETRNYVQRVMENYEVYKARLGQKPEIEHDLRFGR